MGREARTSTVGFLSTRSILQERDCSLKRSLSWAIDQANHEDKSAWSSYRLHGARRCKKKRWMSRIHEAVVDPWRLVQQQHRGGIHLSHQEHNRYDDDDDYDVLFLLLPPYLSLSKLRERIARLFAALGTTNM